MGTISKISLILIMVVSFGAAAEIESVKFEPATQSNVIRIFTEPLPQGATSVTYRVWFSSGNINSRNNWLPLPDTGNTTLKHYIGDRLGDFRYIAQHSYDNGLSWLPPWTGTTGIDPPPASVSVSPYIHSIQRGPRTDLENEESQLGMGPSWFFRYQLFDDSYVSIQIYPVCSSVTWRTPFGFPGGISTTTVVRTLVHKVPRSGEMAGSTWWNTDEWDCRDNAGNIVLNGIYIVSIDAYDKHWRPFDPTDTNPPVPVTGDPLPRTGRRGNAWFSVPVNVLRIMNLFANPIVDHVGLKTFTYRLTGASNVRIRVYRDAPTFSVAVDSNTASPTYGEPIPSDWSKLVRTLNFFRSAGKWEEQWDGRDANGNPLPDGIYTYSISAINDYKRIATDMFGNDRPIFGNVTIMRTAPPSNVEGGATVGSGNIVLGTYSPARGAVVRSGVSSVIVGVEASKLGISASNSYMNITKPNGATVKGSIFVTDNSVVARVPVLTEPGVYTADLKIASLNNRNWWVERFSFTIESPPLSFSEKVYAYPNPARDVVRFNLPVNFSKGEIMIRNIAGDLIKEDTLHSSAHTWDSSALGNGLYFYTIEIDGEKVTKPLIIAR